MQALAALALVATVACASQSAPADGGAAAASEPTTVALEPSRDATLVESSDGGLANGSGGALFVGRTGQPRDSRRRALLAFDVAGSLPAGAEVVSATLTLTLEHTHSGELPIELRPVLASWGEGPSSTPGGRGAPSEPGDVTWVHRAYPGATWESPGGDFGEEVVAVASPAGGDRTMWGPTPEMTAAVQGWLDRPDESFGWLLLGDESASGTAKSFASRESADEDRRPRLTVTYRPPAPAGR